MPLLRDSTGSPAAAPSTAAGSDGNALQLHDAFVQAIKDLTAMHEAQKAKCEKLEQVILNFPPKHHFPFLKTLLTGMPRRGAVSLEAGGGPDRAEPGGGVHVQVARREDQLRRHQGRPPRRPGQTLRVVKLLCRSFW